MDIWFKITPIPVFFSNFTLLVGASPKCALVWNIIFTDIFLLNKCFSDISLAVTHVSKSAINNFRFLHPNSYNTTMKIMWSRKQEMSNFSFCLQFLSCINANSCCTIFGKLISPTYRCNVFRYMIIIFLFVIIFLIFIFVNLYFSIVSSYIFIQVKMCIDRLPVAVDAQLIASSLFGWLVDLFKTAKKMHFSKFWDSQQNGKSNSADPRVNTIKSPQSNPDISNGQLKTHLLRRFWGEYFWTALAASKFDGVITPECPEFLDTLVSTSAVEDMKVIFSRLATYFVNWYLQTRSINIIRFLE